MERPPMQPPSRQPIGFWTARAGEAVRARTRGALAEIGVTQPEWWVLHQLSLYPDGVDREKVVATVGPNDTPAVIGSAVDDAVAKGWIRTGDGALTLSATGGELFDRAAAVQQALQAERMVGITEDEFATTISVLQRTITNVGGDAWHW